MSAGNPKFAFGSIVATPGALEAIEDSGQSPHEFLNRHLRLEQGDLCPEDHELNQQAIEDGMASSSKAPALLIAIEEMHFQACCGPYGNGHSPKIAMKRVPKSAGSDATC